MRNICDKVFEKVNKGPLDDRKKMIDNYSNCKSDKNTKMYYFSFFYDSLGS